ILVCYLALIATLGIFATAIADTDIRVVWQCKINDGKEMNDVRAANSKWVKFVNANVQGGAITSHIVTAIVGDVKPGRFLYVDTFPSIESWSASIDALEG
ncbi:MAG: hypothetical protein ACE5OQ_13470, partial [Woeseia sp.]